MISLVCFIHRFFVEILNYVIRLENTKIKQSTIR